ncbi:MAG: hypothetical protein JEZ10_02960 [Verrucomicrobia bacterium]|nr:hypothetical protein [Verrucomicrobiota bacterium]
MMKKSRGIRSIVFAFLLMMAMAASVQANLLQNPGFEANSGGGGAADNWMSTAEPGTENWATHTGAWGMSVVTWRGTGTGYFYQDVAVVGNSPYTYNIWTARDPGTLTGQYTMKIEWYDGATYLSTDSLLLSDISDVWAQKTLSVTSPAAADLARVMISFSSINIVGKFDDAEFIGLSGNAPYGVVSTGHDSRIDLRWTADTDADGYNVYRSSSAGGPFAKLNASPHAVSVYSDFFGSNNQTYYYYVTSLSGGLESDPSATVSSTSYAMTDDQLLTSVQEAHFRYFWDYGHPVSGLIRESSGFGHSADTCAPGATGMGLMAICVGADRGFVTRAEAAERTLKIMNFLGTNATRYHGAWAHWVNGTTGETIPFSQYDDGADLIETAFLAQGLLTARQYFDGLDPVETSLRNLATQLWEGIEWDWYLYYNNGRSLAWHWSPNYGWQMGMSIGGWNEGMIPYILAVASPTHPIPASAYYTGWAGYDHFPTDKSYYGYRVWAGDVTPNGGNLFWTHYSYLGFYPDWNDWYCNYFDNNRNISLVQRAYAIDNPGGFTGYGDSMWGFTSSFGPTGYSGHEIPTEDDGTVAPTAFLSAMAYTPAESIATMKYLYHTYGQAGLWREFGFVDAFNLHQTPDWYAQGYLGIDQGPIVIMMENSRTALCWALFMTNPEIQSAVTAIENVEFADDKLGSPAIYGSLSVNAGTYTLTGSGADFWNNYDEGQFAYRRVSGDCQITARIVSMSNTDFWAKAGVMIRKSRYPNSECALMAMTPDTKNAAFCWRSTQGGLMADSVQNNLTFPYWVRLVRVGDTFKAYHSSDGTSWTQQGSTQTIAMGEDVYLGLAVSSHNNAALCTTVFDNLDIQNGADTTAPTPNPAGFAVAPAADSSSAISMTATTGSDASGPVEYLFTETSGNPGATSSGWQTSANYTDTGLNASTLYTYTVTLRDSLGNTGNASAPVNATTDAVVGWAQILYDDFEGGLGNWVDGGSDCLLYTGGSYAYQGSNALNLQDNSSSSIASTGNLALSGYSEIKVDFAYYCYSMDRDNEDFWLQISTNGGASYTTVEEWNLNDEFVNNQFYTESVTIIGYTLTDQTRIRFRCDASGDIDDVYIDTVTVSAQ